MPPRSTNAPKLTTDDTTPLRTSPGRRLSRKASRCSRWVSSSHARRLSTTLLRFLSSSMILASTSEPTYGCRSRTRRNSTSEAGMKPRRPMSTIRPPLTTSITRPLTAVLDSRCSSIRPQARSYWARFLDRISRPSLSSRVMTKASIASPRATTSPGSTSWRMLSSRAGITPSDLKPMSSRNLFFVDADDRALHDLAVLDDHHGGGVGVVEADVAEVVLDDLARDVGAVLGEGAHVGGRGWLEDGGGGVGHGVFPGWVDGRIGPSEATGGAPQLFPRRWLRWRGQLSPRPVAAMAREVVPAAGRRDPLSPSPRPTSRPPGGQPPGAPAARTRPA